MIQKIQKAQALSEMALFGSIILLCFYYLLNYIQKMNEQQFVIQEAFRSALEKANTLDGSASYTVFSNRRGSSINNPLVGETIQASGSGSILWGKSGDSEVWYNFNGEEVELNSEGIDSEDIEDTEIVSSENTNLDTSINYNDSNIVSSRTGSSEEQITYNFKDSSGTTIYSNTQTVSELMDSRNWTVTK
jgi:NACalpha-BTF3-like transcription factor